MKKYESPEETARALSDMANAILEAQWNITPIEALHLAVQLIIAEAPLTGIEIYADRAERMVRKYGNEEDI